MTRPIGRPPLSASGPSRRLTVHLPPELDARLREIAELDGTTPAQVTRDALEEHLR